MSGLKSLPQCTQPVRRKSPAGAASAATGRMKCRQIPVGAEAPPTVHPAGSPQVPVGVASAATGSLECRQILVGAEAPPTVHPAGSPQVPCRSGFSRDRQRGCRQSRSGLKPLLQCTQPNYRKSLWERLQSRRVKRDTRRLRTASGLKSLPQCTQPVRGKFPVGAASAATGSVGVDNPGRG